MLILNASNIFKKIDHSAMQSGRNPDEIKLVAVTKAVVVDVIKEAIGGGLRVFGENRIQESQNKIQIINSTFPNINIQWHFIGRLQRNKARYAVKLFDLIHSVDSIGLALELDKQSKRIDKIQNILVEVKLSDEETKSGVLEKDLPLLLEKIKTLSNLKLQGFMAIPPFFENQEESRPYFKRLREIRQGFEQKGFNLPELSMGMSTDFEAAIEEGATIVRIGTAIFGERK